MRRNWFILIALVGFVAVSFGRHPAAPPAPVAGPPVAAAPLHRMAKEQIAREAAIGRRSLLEAAALFRALDRISPEPPGPDGAGPSRTDAGRTDQERLCRQVMAYVRTALRDAPPDAVSAALGRLEDEFQDNLRRFGAIRLPDPGAVAPVQKVLAQVRNAVPESVDCAAPQ